MPPVAVAVNCTVWPLSMVDVVGAIDTLSCGFIVTVAVADAF